MPPNRDERRPMIRIACLPRVLETNPYQRLLYDALERTGEVSLVDGVSLRTRDLVRRRRSADVLHLHWLEGFYRDGAGTRRARPLALARTGRLAARLAVARARGYRILWTAHQVEPHERRTPWIDVAAARAVAALAHALVVHDETTLLDVRRRLGHRAALKTSVVPHGTFAGAYDTDGDRASTRRRLDIDEDAHVFLSFGHVRAYKGLDTVVAAFAAVPEPDAVLLIAGMVHDEDVRARLAGAAARDRRIRLDLRFVPDAEVMDLFAAADTAVVARSDGGTSGALVLAASVGIPVVAADAPAYRAVAGSSAEYAIAGDPAAFAAAMRRALRRREPAAAAALPSWDSVAAATLRVVRRLAAPERADVLLVASSGGHLLQLLALADAWRDSTRRWVVEDTSDARSLLADEEATFIPWLTERSIPGLLRGLVLAQSVVRRSRPRILITTGAAPAVPFAWVAHLLRVKVVYVESITRIDEPSLSCRLVRSAADRVYVQWPELQRMVPESRYAGAVLEAA